MRQTYLCSNCKKSGLKTSKAMLFETFFCPKCKKNTTLFLSKKSDSTVESKEEINSLINNQISVINNQMPELAVMPANTQVDCQLETEFNCQSTLKADRLFYLRDAIMFMIGFIAALLIMKN